MVTRSEKIKAGIFFLSGVVILVGFLLLLGYLQGGRTGVGYTSLFESVRSLQEGVAVKYSGVEVGEVTSIKIAESDPGKVRVDYLVEQPHARHITGNTVAQLVYLNPLSGQQCISLSPARTTAPAKQRRLPPGETIPTQPSDVAATVEAIQQSLNNLNSLLSENRQYVGDLLKNTDEVMRSFRVLVGQPPHKGEETVGLIQVTDQIAKMLPRLEEISERTERTMEEAEGSFENIRQISTRLEDMMDRNQENITAAVEDLSRTAAALREAVETNQPRIGSAAADLQQASEQVKELVGDIRGAWPSGQVQQDMRNWSQTVAELRKVTAQSSRLARSLQDNSAALDSVIARNREPLRSSLQDLARAAQNLKELTAALKARPSSVLFGGDEDKRELQ